MIIKAVDVTIGGGVPPAPISVSQYDDMWSFEFTPYYNGEPWPIPSGASVTIRGKKPDGHAFAFNGAISDGKVTVVGDVQMTACPGVVPCELRFEDAAGKTVGTANFALLVERAPMQEDDIISDTETSVLRGWLNKAVEATGNNSEAAAKAAQEAKEAKSSAGASASSAKEDADAARLAASSAGMAMGTISRLAEDVSRDASFASQASAEAIDAKNAANTSATEAALSAEEAKRTNTSLYTGVIPAGWMRGDPSHDSVIDARDVAMAQQMSGAVDQSNLTQVAADADNNGIVDNLDRNLINTVYSQGGKYGQLGDDITGQWKANPNYETETAQFYTDLDVDVPLGHDVALAIGGKDTDLRTVWAEVLASGKIRLWVSVPPTVDCPFSAVAAPGTGVVTVTQQIDVQAAMDECRVRMVDLYVAASSWNAAKVQGLIYDDFAYTEAIMYIPQGYDTKACKDMVSAAKITTRMAEMPNNGGYRLVLTANGDVPTEDFAVRLAIKASTAQMPVVSSLLPWGGNTVQTVTGTIPMGWMYGDCNHDGIIDHVDGRMIQANYSNKDTEDPMYAIADVTHDGKINVTDYNQACGRSIITERRYGKFGDDYTGNWTANPDWGTEAAQFYRDIAVPGAGANTDIWLRILGDSAQNWALSAEVMEPGLVRLWVAAPPVADCPFEAVITSGTGIVAIDQQYTPAQPTRIYDDPVTVTFGADGIGFLPAPIGERIYLYPAVTTQAALDAIAKARLSIRFGESASEAAEGLYGIDLTVNGVQPSSIRIRMVREPDGTLATSYIYSALPWATT